MDVFAARSEAIELPLIVKGDGIFLWDDAGNRYTDVSSGPVVSNIGHGRAEVADAIAHQARTVDFAYPRVARHKPNVELAERLSRLAGPGYERVYFSSGGSEAVETAIKFLRQYRLATGQPDRTELISCLPSYHGGTLGMLAVSGDVRQAKFLSGFAKVSHKIPAPLSYRTPEAQSAGDYAAECAEALERKILEVGPARVLAFVIEPVGGLATGCIVPPVSYFERIREITRRHGIFLIYDEVLCGMGRTGHFLASHRHRDAAADVVVLAKGLAAGYAPLGATLFPAEMVDELAATTGYSVMHTYAANPISCAAALAVLDVYEKEKLIEHVPALGTYLRDKLELLKAEHPIIGDVRGQGLLFAVELVSDRTTKAQFSEPLNPADMVRRHGLEQGLIIYSRRTSGGAFGDWFMVSPPLSITRSQVDELCGRLSRTLGAMSRELGLR
ncbi:MAG: aspartate aminotransferase family protein [Silicimonas sp.]